MALTKVTGQGIDSVTVDSSGKVGIGTSSPNANTKLDVNGAARIGNSTDGIMIENNSGAFDISNAAYIRRNSSSGELELTAGSTTARNMIFNTGTNGAESMRITSNGKVGIGTTSPTVELEIANSAPQMRIIDTDTNAIFQINASSTTGGVDLQADATGVGSNPFMAFDVGGSEAMRIDSSRTVTATAINASQSSQTAIGATCMGWLNNTTTNPGTSRAGTSISFSNTIGGYRPSTFGVGTWRCHGAVQSGSLDDEVSVWQRIS